MVAAACEHLGFSSLSDVPEHLPYDPQDVPKYFQETCNAVLEKAFHPIIFDVQSDVPEGPFCICQEKLDIAGPMVGCAHESCDRGLWFHLQCIGEKCENLPSGDWYCTENCQQQHKTAIDKASDSVYEYSIAVLFLGLGEIMRHDAIQEGDGRRMMNHWKIDLHHFYQGHHWKYLTEGHNLIMDINGGVSERLAHQLVWNRTVNIDGGKGRNISCDLAGVEFVNRDYQEAVKAAGGSLSEDVKTRNRQTAWLKKTFNSLFDTRVTGSMRVLEKHVVRNRDPNIASLVDMLLQQKCLVRTTRRFHAGFENFKFSQRLSDKDEFLKKMSALCTERVKRVHVASLI